MNLDGTISTSFTHIYNTFPKVSIIVAGAVPLLSKTRNLNPVKVIRYPIKMGVYMCTYIEMIGEYCHFASLRECRLKVLTLCISKGILS